LAVIAFPPDEAIAPLKKDLEEMLGVGMSSDNNQHNKVMALSGNRRTSGDSANLTGGLDLASQCQAFEGESLELLQAPPVPTNADREAKSTLEASEFFTQGLQKFNRGDDRSAIEEFNQALQLNPDFAEAYSYRARIRQKKGDYLGAAQDYSQVLRISPSNAEAYCHRGLIRAELGDRWGATQDYNQALQIDSNHIKTYLNRSLMRVELEDYQGAITDCDAVLKINPNLPKAYLNRGLARFELDDYQNAMDDFNQALQINPNLAEAYLNRGASKVALGEYQAAIADFNQAIHLNPDYAQAYLNRGYTRLQLGDNWGSIEDFDEAMRLDPAAAKAFFNQMSHTLNDELNAIEDKNQQLAQGLIVQGNLRYESGDYQAALDAYNQALSLDPNNTEAYNRRSTVRSALGDYQGAMEDLKAVTNLSVNHELSSQLTSVATVEVTAKDYYHQGVDKLQKGDFQKAVEDFDRVLQLKGNDATTLTCRGFAYRRLGDYGRAITDLQKAAKLFFEQGDVQSSLEIEETLKKLQQ